MLLKLFSLLCNISFIGFIETLVLKSIPSIFIFLDKRIELSRSFIEASSEIGRKIKYFLAKQRGK